MGSNLLDRNGRYYDVEQYIINPNYTGRDIAYFADIGLIKLDEEIQFSDRVQPIKIHENVIQGDETLRATGWGRLGNDQPIPNALQELETFALSNQQCKDITQFLDPTSQICVFSARGKGVCFVSNFILPIEYNFKNILLVINFTIG